MEAGSVEVSVVLPAYNEADTLTDTVRRTNEALSAFVDDGNYEVLIAEDGCTDRTPEIAARLAANDPRINHVHSTTRLGRGRALTNAFSESHGDVIVYFDTDLATDLDHLPELITSVRSGDADIATGSRRLPGNTISRPPKRGIPSAVYNGLVRFVLRSRMYDHQCGFKAFDRAVLFSLLDDIEDDHWFWDTEILVRAQRAGFTIHEFPVGWTPKTDTSVDLVRDVFGMGSQVIRLWWQVSVQPKITRRRTVVAGIGLTVLAIALMTVYLNPRLVIDELVRADPVLVGLAVGVYLVSWPLRGARYQVILGKLGHRSSLGFLTSAIFISQTGNLVFPARAGDAIRAYVIKTRRSIPYPTGFASLAIERVFDLLAITVFAGVIGGIGFAGEIATLAHPDTTDPIARSGQTAIFVAGTVGLIAFLVVGFILLSSRSDRNRIRPVVRRFSTDSYAIYVSSILEQFVHDIQTVTSSRRSFWRIGVGSLGIWGLDVITAYLVLLALTPNLSTWMLLAVCFFAVSVGNLAKILPISPGGIGLYEGAFTLIIISFTPLSVPLALGAAILDHAIKNITTILGGWVSLVNLNISLRTAIEEGRDAALTDAD